MTQADLYAHLRALLVEDAGQAGAGFAFAVSRDCGSFAVSILGPSAALRLSIDAAQMDAAQIRFDVGRAIARYRSGLGLADSAASEAE